jgi:CheY-like chemotaxis protein
MKLSPSDDRVNEEAELGHPRSCHILVVDRDPACRQEVMRSLGERHPDVLANFVSSTSEAVTELQRAGYDAVLLRMDEPGEVAFLLRIKASVPATPVFALVPETNRDLDELARESGADRVVLIRSDLGRLIAEVRETIGSTEGLIRRSRAAAQQNRMMELLIQGKTLRAQNFDLSRIPVAKFAPLMIEDDPNQALLMLRCFEKVMLPFPLPVMRDGEEALDYLDGRGKYGDRARYPLPTLVIADLHLPKMSGFEILSWIRARPELARLVVFILTSSPLREDLERAYLLGADYYFVKPMPMVDLLEMVKVLAMRWGLLHRAQRA